MPTRGLGLVAGFMKGTSYHRRTTTAIRAPARELRPRLAVLCSKRGSARSRTGTGGTRCGLSGRMRPDPSAVVRRHLLRVVRNMPFLTLDPGLEADRPFLGEFCRVQPHRLGNRYEELISHLAEAANHLERLPGTLMKVAQIAGPSRGVKLHNREARFGNQVAAAHVGTSFTIREVKDDLVDAPALRRRFVEPHFLRELPQNAGQERRCAPK